LTIPLEIKAYLLQSYINLIRISREQRIHLFSILPLKLVTPLSINDVTSALLHAGQPKLFGRLSRCGLGKTMYCQCEVHHKRIINNVVLALSQSSILKINELQRRPPKSLFNDILHYNDACTEF